MHVHKQPFSSIFCFFFRSFVLAKDMFFGKQKFDVKQLKMNKFIKSIWQVIISTSNTTLDVASLRPCMFIITFNMLKYKQNL